MCSGCGGEYEGDRFDAEETDVNGTYILRRAMEHVRTGDCGWAGSLHAYMDLAHALNEVVVR